MMASRGMGVISKDKMPKGKTMTRKDGDKFTMYNKGGKVKHPKSCNCKACGGKV